MFVGTISAGARPHVDTGPADGGKVHSTTNPQGKEKGWAKNGKGGPNQAHGNSGEAHGKSGEAHGKSGQSHGKSAQAHDETNPDGKFKGWSPNHVKGDDEGTDD